MPDWIELKAKRVLMHDARRKVWDCVICTNPSTVHPSMLPAAAHKVYFVQMAEQHFFAEAQWKAIVDTYKVAAREGYTAITIANWVRDFLLSEECGFADVRYIKNGVNTKHFYPVDQEPHAPYILLEGDNRNPAKDVAGYACQIATKLRGEFGVELRGMAATTPPWCGDLDEFVFRPSEADYRRLYSGALFLLKTTRYDARSCAPVEAMACGTPTIRGLIEGDDDLIHGYNCLRSGYDMQSVYEHALNAMRNQALLDELSYNALEYANSQLAWEPIIDELEIMLLG